MAIRLSTALRNYILNHGSLAEALAGSQMIVYSGTQPNGADDAHTSTILSYVVDNDGALVTNTGLNAYGNITLTGGAGGTVDDVTVDGNSILSAAVPYNTSLTQTAADLAAAIRASVDINHGLYVYSDAAVVYLVAKKGYEAKFSGGVVSGSFTTITGTYNNLGTQPGGTPANGLYFETSGLGATISKRTGQVWSGEVVNTGAASWFRIVGQSMMTSAEDDPSSADTDLKYLRLDGSIGTADATLILNDVDLVVTEILTIADFTLTAISTP